ncbi:MAG TPA: hypothetical protein VII06_04290 [Chloroflexota bacterium]|jgi:hypothetical protein
MPLGAFLALALVYAVAALVTLWSVVRDWRALFDDVWTPQDNQLAQRVGFLLLTPPLVWLHELGHATAMRFYGATDPQIHFFLYLGFVTSRYPFTPIQNFVVFLAGPLVTYLLGIGLLAVALLVPLRPAVALALASCAIVNLALVLVMYPAMSLAGGWGDFVGIYQGGVPMASLVVGVVHVASLVAFGWLMNRVWMKGFLAYPVARPWRLQWRPTVPQGDAPQ